MSRREMDRILLVEDDAPLRDLLCQELSDRGYGVRDVENLSAASPVLQHDEIDLILSDIRLPDGSGLDILDAVQVRDSKPAVMLMTAFGSVPQAVEALKAGADDFLTKPLDLEHLCVRIDRVLSHRRTGVTLAILRDSIRRTGRDRDFHGMIGNSAAMQQLYVAIRRIANVEESVLVHGESGTGKDLVARAIHALSARSEAPFVAINCASVPETLLEAEFFGHTKGAFTGAAGAREGLFREADGGTLFLDEIGEMPATLQAKLLRVLQDGRIRPVGADSEVEVDVRIVAATNRDLEADVRSGAWREDLFYRLDALAIGVPPLRERQEDIPLLASFFLARIAMDRELPSLRLTERALDAIQAYQFPGNVRELANALARAATFCDDDRIDVNHLPQRMRGSDGMQSRAPDPLGISGTPPPTLEQVERRYIRWVLEHAGHNKRRAAEILGVGRRTIYRKLDNRT